MHLRAPSSNVRTHPYAKVALPVPLATLFTYDIPSDLADKVSVGRRVDVPFGKRVLSGIVVELADATEVAKTRPIKNVYDTYLTPELLKLTEWMAAYYGCSVGEAAQSVLPPALKPTRVRPRLQGTLRLVDGVDNEAMGKALKRARRQLELAEALVEAGGALDIETANERGFKTEHIKALIEKGFAERVDKVHTSTLDTLEDEVTKLTPHQTEALARVTQAIAGGAFEPMLVHGVTGSGKTELYIRAARFALEAGGGCIILVPEIGLLPQAIARYKRVFGDELAVMHSRLTGPERHAMWSRIESGEARVVLGPRSSVFSPVRNLRMIVVDEEQDESYKQTDKPRYHARNVALMRGKNEKLTVVMGSATPSAETYHHASEGRYALLDLPHRVSGAPMPTIDLVDMREAPMEGTFFSEALLERIESTLERGQQAILFLNKRGHARYVQCNTCGWVARCDNCDISLIYHRVSRRLRCHFCGYNRSAVDKCDTCGGSKLFFAGAGTQRVELDLQGFFPGVGILRMDADTTSGKEGHRRVLEEFGTGKYPLLIGTQMVTKGHHFPGVHLVGVLFAEDSLNYPDFRSSERTFQLLTQVSGRAGRAGKQGEVVVQTFVPEHAVFAHLLRNDYAGFMHNELEVRKQLRYPPFARLVLASCTATSKVLLHRVIHAWAAEMRRLSEGRGFIVLGPVSPLVERIKGRFREHVMIKGRLTSADKAELLALFERVAERERGGRSVDLRWDVDPESFV